MIAKTFEVRDEGTFMPILAVCLESETEADRYLLARAGYGRTPIDHREYVMVWRLAGGGNSPATTDVYDHSGGRTMQLAHAYIKEHFHRLQSGEVIDVEFISGESTKPKLSERFEY